MLNAAEIEKIKKELKEASKQINSPEELEELRVKFLGRKQGLITNLYKEIPKLKIEDKKELVPLLNKLKSEAESLLTDKIVSKEKPARALATFSTEDLTIPGKKPSYGHAHPTIKIINEIKEIFHPLGFGWLDGPEIEFDLYNFQKLRLHKDHPARDLQQTYYLSDEILLRTQTSTMQIRYMEKNNPPIRMLFPGRVYRVEQLDSTHLPAFYQVEGLLVDEKIGLTDLLGTLEYFAKKMFGEEAKIRVYGHHFPYTEPSIEVEVLHKSGKWIEIMGAGMVHPEVLKNVGIDPKKYRGFAFGMGPERIAMLKYGIDDIRLFYQNQLEFLEQF
ncbi:MAG TPA: phenylalanine--tRNA ligase subunit alpha [Candidatus Saccharimonadales bacterium]|nr:phenylalanine--tRNA ligase subunit alpha [Candidatus Saccharimonadales bacterium]